MHNGFPNALVVIDSHTEGEPTRVVVEGWPEPDGEDMRQRRDNLAAHADHLRGAIINEPRGHSAMVGALLTCPVSAGAEAGVIFFNNVGYLGMCGHGLIGVVRTLEFLGRLTPGRVEIDTPAGTVAAELDGDGAVTIRNVPSYVHALDVQVRVEGVGVVTGDVAYGGNWFFITHLPDVELAAGNRAALLHVTGAIQRALDDAGITGAHGARIDHVELSARCDDGSADASNFVLCPGGEYDRSPCGTGTSAKMAVLHARGELAPGRVWRQRSVTGGVFDGWIETAGDSVIPHIRGRAFITGEAVLRFDSADPFRAGLDT
ncbi:MAG TPA: proline racemase family protein [Longimicrobiales bacterium]|nr:proline racemase family protein [Longimicrobiales bacterium]